jgi:hypothetical protein
VLLSSKAEFSSGTLRTIHVTIPVCVWGLGNQDASLSSLSCLPHGTHVGGGKGKDVRRGRERRGTIREGEGMRWKGNLGGREGRNKRGDMRGERTEKQKRQ